MTAIVDRLRAMSRCEHDDLSIGNEAADERLRGNVRRLQEALARATDPRTNQ